MFCKCNKLHVVGSTIIIESGLSLSLSIFKETILLPSLKYIIDFAKLKFIEFSNCKQIIEAMGILPNRVYEGARSDLLMGPQSSNDITSEITIPRSEIPKWFNHCSVGNSISFWVGRRFPNLFAICIALGTEEEAQRSEYSCFVRVDASINGCETLHFGVIDFKENPNHLWLYCRSI